MADEIVEEFLVESGEALERIEQDLVELEEDKKAAGVVDRIFRDVHTIKGVCGFLGYSHMETVTHAAESLLSKVRAGEVEACEEVVSVLLTTVDAIREMLSAVEKTGEDGELPYTALVEKLKALQDATPERAKSTPPLGEVLVQRGIATAEAVAQALKSQEEGDPRKLGEILVRKEHIRPDQVDEALELQQERRAQVRDTTIRVNVDLLDRLMNLVGELVLVRNQILQSDEGGGGIAVGTNAQRLNLVTSELQEGVMKTRMQPIGTIWGKFPRVVRDLAHACEKQMRLEMEGRQTELDKTLIEAIKDPLTHLVRNACDHGVETPADRIAAGKPEEGVLWLRAYHEGGQVIIEIADDGKGIDPHALTQKALERGLITEEHAARMSEREALKLIFLPGFSTAEKVTNVSGRGVGMDVVKTNIERIGGTLDLSSTMGEGTTIRIKIPLTLAIIPALIVQSEGDCYAIPQVSLLELVLLEGEDLARIETIQETPVYRLRGQLLPLLYLSEALGLGRPGHSQGAMNIVILQADQLRFGLVVDAVRDTEEIVVKPLGQELKALSAYAGATIMGDGTVALILDVMGLARTTKLVTEDHRTSSHEQQGPTDRAMSEAESLLLFQGPSETQVAVRLTRIDRLEEFALARVERLTDREVVQYRGSIMPMIHLAHTIYGVDLPTARHREENETYQVVVIRRGKEVFGLVVGQLVDIVDSVVDLKTVGRRPGIQGSAIVQGRVVELLDIDAVFASALPELWAEGQSMEAV
ncbi:MAG: chemotaxis protein CheW [Sandaracinaceae bacterium]